MHRCRIKSSIAGRSDTPSRPDPCLKCQSILTQNTQSYCTARTCETSNWWRTNSKFCSSSNNSSPKCRCSKSTFNTRCHTNSTWAIQRQKRNKRDPKRKASTPRTKRIFLLGTKALASSTMIWIQLRLVLRQSTRNRSHICLGISQTLSEASLAAPYKLK